MTAPPACRKCGGALGPEDFFEDLRTRPRTVHDDGMSTFGPLHMRCYRVLVGLSQPVGPDEALAMREWIAAEQRTLWYDLDQDLRRAIGGPWSIAALNTARRIGEAARLVGPTEHGAIPWTLVRGGVYAALLQLAGVGTGAIDPIELARLDTLMDRGDRANDRGFPSSDYPEKYRPAVEALRDRDARTFHDLAGDLWPTAYDAPPDGELDPLLTCAVCLVSYQASQENLHPTHTLRPADLGPLVAGERS